MILDQWRMQWLAAYCACMQVGVSNYGAKELRRVARDFEKRGVQLASAQVGCTFVARVHMLVVCTG
jgi:diketogulonate reductase-like aldo/keto reductase